jgi:uncharacterized membrane protein
MNAVELAHLLAALIWVGGMFFAYVVLRPSAVEVLAPPQRLMLWNVVFRRFFVWVWAAVAVLPLTGFFMIRLYGGFSNVSKLTHAMMACGLLMIGIFGYVFFVCYGRFKHMVTREHWQEAGAMLGRIRRLIAVNLVLGLFTVCAGVIASR